MALETARMMGVRVTTEGLGLPKDVRKANAPLRKRLNMSVDLESGREYISTLSQGLYIHQVPEIAIDRLKEHEIPLNASLGVWFFLKGATRFHEGYEDAKKVCGGEKGSKEWVEWVFNKVAKMQERFGYKISLQAHYPNEIGPRNVATWVRMMEKTGIGVDSIVPLLFAPAEFQNGSLTNPNNNVRELAQEVQRETFQLAALLGIPVVNHWLGIDGYENAFGVNHAWAFNQIAGSTAEAMAEVKGQQATFEPKPYEPRQHNFCDYTHTGLLLAREVEERIHIAQGKTPDLNNFRTMVGLTPEIGHMQMGFESLPYSFELALREGRLFGIHWNSQPAGNYDVDANPGIFNVETLMQIAYVLQRGGFTGVNCLDINPLRMDLEDAVEVSFMNLQATFSQVRKLPHELIAKAIANPGKGNAALEHILLASRVAGPPLAHDAKKRAEVLLSEVEETRAEVPPQTVETSAKSGDKNDKGGEQGQGTPFSGVKTLKDLKELISDQLRVGEDKISTDSKLVEGLGADSLDLIEIAMALEEELNIEISDKEIESCGTFKDVVALLKEKGVSLG